MGIRGRWLGIGLACWLVATGCGETLVIRIPDAPRLPFQKDARPPGPSDERAECAFMTILIDFSRHGEVGVAARVARAMEREFEKKGVRITRTNEDAYWSLMILASENSRGDGYIFSAMLSARNMNEGYDPGVTVFQRDGEADPAKPVGKIPTMYNGLSYGPFETLDEQAKVYVQQAYGAVFPHARQLCEFEKADREREKKVEEQVPAPPSPL